MFLGVEEESSNRSDDIAIEIWEIFSDDLDVPSFPLPPRVPAFAAETVPPPARRS